MVGNHVIQRYHTDTETCFIAGPFGLAMAMSLARQGVTFRIIGNYSSCRIVSLVVKQVASFGEKWLTISKTKEANP